MKTFARLFTALDETPKTTEKIAILSQYFATESDTNKIWAVWLLSGKRPKRPLKATLIRQYATEMAEIPMWLFEESWHTVGDLADTITYVLPEPDYVSDRSLAEWGRLVVQMNRMSDAEKKQCLLNAWASLSGMERFLFNKILTGGFRIGVSETQLIRAISSVENVDPGVLAHRLAGKWTPMETQYADLVSDTVRKVDLSKPYPFCLAYPIDGELSNLGAPDEWAAEWKWDGIRIQLIKRGDQSYLWSRGEELITDRFPEFFPLFQSLPNGVVLEGEMLIQQDGHPAPFKELQTRIIRKRVTANLVKKTPAIIYAYDCLETNGEDLRSSSFSIRRQTLENILQPFKNSHLIQLSPMHDFSNWDDLQIIQKKARDYHAEGMMLKRWTSPYTTEGQKGDWWKWKVDPFSVDAILIYAQQGQGGRSSLFTDYTFGLWEGDRLVTIAKADSGLTKAEIEQVDQFVRQNTMEKFGPVRTVKPELVFEIGFESLAPSNRHKSGIVLRFPRILSWQYEKKPEDADDLQALKNLLPK